MQQQFSVSLSLNSKFVFEYTKHTVAFNLLYSIQQVIPSQIYSKYSL